MSLSALEFAPVLGLVMYTLHLHRRVERAGRDPVTGLHTRGEWTRRARRAVRDPSAAVVFIDLNRFKEVNDTHGHPAGDRVLAEIGRRLKNWRLPSEPAGRLGGDEFAVVVKGPDVHQRIAMLPSILSIPIPDVLVEVTASIGYASTAGNPGADLARLIQLADQAMYETKHATRSLCQNPHPASHSQKDSLDVTVRCRLLLRDQTGAPGVSERLAPEGQRTWFESHATCR